MKYLYLCSALLLAGCTATSSGGSFMDGFSWEKTDHNKCTNYGFERGTPEYGNCRLALEQQRSQAQSAGLAVGMGALVAQQQARQRQMPVTCSRMGNVVNCY